MRSTSVTIFSMPLSAPLLICLSMRPPTTLLYFTFFVLHEANTTKNRCYSCASINMQQDFLTKKRGPQKRIAQPKMFDNFCDLDVWIIKERSSIDCEGACFKWQQILNNSGSYSYMTLRSCYTSMFDQNDVVTASQPQHSYCSTRSTLLECLPDAHVIEDLCWCQGDYCNGTIICKLSVFSIFALLYSLALS